MELLLIAGFVAALLLSWWLRRHWIEGSRIEPWAMMAGALFLLALAWGPGVIESRGPQVIVSLGALLAMLRAFQIFRQRAGDGHGEVRPEN